jgi:hypothetical protein
MATKNGSLEQAMTLLIQNQAAFMQNQTALLTHLSDTKMEVLAMRKDLEQIKTILLRHDQTLTQLPEAIRQKIGYKPR